jgi:hypothetical protein
MGFLAPRRRMSGKIHEHVPSCIRSCFNIDLGNTDALLPHGRLNRAMQEGWREMSVLLPPRCVGAVVNDLPLRCYADHIRVQGRDREVRAHPWTAGVTAGSTSLPAEVPAGPAPHVLGYTSV